MGRFKEGGLTLTGNLFEEIGEKNTEKKPAVSREVESQEPAVEIEVSASPMPTVEKNIANKNEEENDQLEQAVIEALKRGYDPKGKNIFYRVLDIYFAGRHDTEHWRQMQEEIRAHQINKEFRYLIVKVRGALKKTGSDNKLAIN